MHSKQLCCGRVKLLCRLSHASDKLLMGCLQVDLSSLSREQLMCLAINLYNALTIHTLVVHGPDKYKSLWRRLQFFSKVGVTLEL